MLQSLNKIKKFNKPTEKIFLTFLILFLFRFGSTLPLSGIDQESIRRSFEQFENKNSLLQVLNMYSGGGTSILTPFSLGILPFINSSILLDLLTALFPSLEKLQSEEGETGRKKINFYKKIITVIFATIQAGFLIFYLKSYLYSTEVFSLAVLLLELVSGSLAVVWLSNLIDSKGIGNGTSLIILTNIVISLIGKGININFFKSNLIILELFFIFFFMILICISQTARINIDVVSARQLAFLENIEKTNLNKKQLNSLEVKDNGLSIRLNQAGIFPIIIASNLSPIILYVLSNFFQDTKFISTILYYILIIGFNYFYTIVFWDPEKISEQLRKASVSIVNITPGKETTSYLENVVRSSSIIGGIFLCLILLSYDLVKQLINGPLLNQINISSLIIVVGVAYEIQKNIKALYKNILKDS